MEFNMKKFIRNYIKRTQTNSQVINEIHMKDLAMNRHNKGVHRVYEVTHMLNSFFGILIVPFEAFKDRDVATEEYPDEIIKQLHEQEKERRMKFLEEMRKSEQYGSIKSFVEKLRANDCYKDNYSKDTKYDSSDSDEVFTFLKRLRNSLSHGGKEGLSFLPMQDLEKKNTPQQLTYVIFHDEWTQKGKKKHTVKVKGESYIKLSIAEIGELYIMISELFKGIKPDCAFTLEQYVRRINRADYCLKNGFDDVANYDIEAITKNQGL